jgi:hypothetical protein
VVAITLQPRGSGDFFGPSSIPAGDGAASVEARVLGLGPTYVDVALRAGSFEAALGPAPNDYHRPEGATNPSAAPLRVRADRFVSRVPYERMVAALCQTTNVPVRTKTADAMRVSGGAPEDASSAAAPAYDNIHMDEVLREAILSTHALADPSNSPPPRDIDSAYDLEELVRRPQGPPLCLGTLTRAFASFGSTKTHTFLHGLVQQARQAADGVVGSTGLSGPEAHQEPSRHLSRAQRPAAGRRRGRPHEAPHPDPGPARDR